MMPNIILYKRPDGGVSIVHPAPGVSIQEVMLTSIPGDAAEVEVVDRSIVPTDREFRDAWEKDPAGGISISLDKAKSIQRERIARLKHAKARDLLERETMGEDVTAEKAQLRSVDETALVSGAGDIATLKGTMPPFLKEVEQ